MPGGTWSARNALPGAQTKNARHDRAFFDAQGQLAGSGRWYSSGTRVPFSLFPIPAFNGTSVPANPPLEPRLRTTQRQLQLADRADALLGQAVGGAVGRDAVTLGDLEDA